MPALPRLAALGLVTLRHPLQRLTRLERAALAAGACLALLQLALIAQLSEASVLKGERLRAEQAQPQPAAIVRAG